MRLGYVIVDWKMPRLARAAEQSIVAHRPLADVVVVDAAKLELSYSEACNTGAEILGERADVVCFLNADVEMLEKDRVIPGLFASHPDLAIVGPRQINAVDKVVHGGIVPHDDESEWHIDPRNRCWMWPLDRADGFTLDTHDAVTVPGSVMYVRRTHLEQLGGWPTWTRFYYEDTFLCYLARHRGLRVFYTGAVTWRHLGEGSPLTTEERTQRMEVARRGFVDACREAEIPLVVPEFAGLDARIEMLELPDHDAVDEDRYAY